MDSNLFLSYLTEELALLIVNLVKISVYATFSVNLFFVEIVDLDTCSRSTAAVTFKRLYS